MRNISAILLLLGLVSGCAYHPENKSLDFGIYRTNQWMGTKITISNKHSNKQYIVQDGRDFCFALRSLYKGNIASLEKEFHLKFQKVEGIEEKNYWLSSSCQKNFWDLEPKKVSYYYFLENKSGPSMEISIVKKAKDEFIVYLNVYSS